MKLSQLCLIVLAAATVVAPARADRESPGRKKPAATPAAKPAATAAAKPAGAAPAPAKPTTPTTPAVMTPAMKAIATPGTAAAPAAAPTGPPGTLEMKDTAFDAGDVDRGKDIEHIFELKNVGKGDLTVDAKPGCGCTVTEFDKIVKPGAIGHVKATVHTVNFKGAITKSITVTTNDAEHAQTVLQIKANVKVPIDVQPSDYVTFDGKHGELAVQTVTLTSMTDKAFDVLSADSSDPKFAVKLTPASTKPGMLGSGAKSYQLTITPAKDVPVGHSSLTVTVKTSDPKAAEIPIRGFITVRGDIEVQPERVIMQVGPGAPDSAKTQHVAIRKPTGSPLKITSIEAANPAIKTTLKTITEGKEYDIEIKFDGAVPTTGFVDSTITVKTNDTEQASISIPFFARQ